MEVAEPQAYAVDPAPEQFQEPQKKAGRRWMKHWVPQDTVLGSGSCFLLKWITEDVLTQLQTKQNNNNVVEEEQEPEDEHEVVYLCTYEGCGKIFPEASGLRKHAHVHGEKQYICKYEGCGKRFVDSSKLKRHCLIHTGEKHFICPFEGCGKAFSLDFNLRSHMRTHTGENYHICPYEDCGKRYAHEYKLKAHMRSFHDKNIPEATVVSPVTDPERDVVAPKYTPPPPPPTVAEKPFACPFEGCNKRYIHEYKLNLHLKNAHMINDIIDEGFRPGRGGTQNEDEIEDESDQDVFQEVVPKYYEQVPKSVEPAQKRKAAPKASGKGKQRDLSKPPAKNTKRKRANPTPPELNLKLDIKHNSAGGSGISRQELKPDVGDDSEETEDEDRDNTEEEDNVKQIGGGHMGQHMSGMMDVSPVTDPERDVVAPKYTPPPPPPTVAEKPFACPFEDCNKRYIHEYKLNLHLKNAHMINDIIDEGFRSGRGGPHNEDEIQYESDQDVFQEVVPKSVEPAQKRKAAPKAAGKGKLRVISKPPAKITKRKRANPTPPEANLKLDIKHSSAGRSGISRQELKPDVGDDSEETEDEDRDNTEEEDNVKHIGGGHMGQHMSGMMDEDDDEETEED